jgi:hypothetical protein
MSHNEHQEKHHSHHHHHHHHASEAAAAGAEETHVHFEHKRSHDAEVVSGVFFCFCAVFQDFVAQCVFFCFYCFTRAHQSDITTMPPPPPLLLLPPPRRLSYVGREGIVFGFQLYNSGLLAQVVSVAGDIA